MSGSVHDLQTAPHLKIDQSEHNHDLSIKGKIPKLMIAYSPFNLICSAAGIEISFHRFNCAENGSVHDR
jgi:hypothetical protein